MIISDRRSSSGSSPSSSPRLSGKKYLENEVPLDVTDNKKQEQRSNVSSWTSRLSKAHNGKSSPKVPSSLATKNQTLEGNLSLVAPIAVTEELEADDCETESETNEGSMKMG